MPSFEGSSSDSFDYISQPTPSLALHLISHSEDPGLSLSPPSGEYYRQPKSRGEDVVVYVMEKHYGCDDFQKPFDRNRLQLLDKDNSIGIQAIKNPKEHGAAIVSLIGGATYGAAQHCTVVVVGRREVEGKDGVFNWTMAMTEVVLDFQMNRKGKAGIMNLSVGFKNTRGRRDALERVLAAGIIVVGAAGNDSANLDDISPTELHIPEAMDDERIIIIGSLDYFGRAAEHSNHGKRVDYWVLGDRVACAGEKTEANPTGIRRLPGTSGATAIASGVIACLLSAGQAPRTQVKVGRGRNPQYVERATARSVRDLLDSWAPVKNGMKYLKNAPGLTQMSVPAWAVKEGQMFTSQDPTIQAVTSSTRAGSHQRRHATGYYSDTHTKADALLNRERAEKRREAKREREKKETPSPEES
jgi:Subtilase family